MPAAVLGTLSGAFAAVPASADAPLVVERQRATSLRAGAAEAPPSSCTVQPGDTVSAIAERYGLRTIDILTANGLDWRSVIYPGQVLSLTGTAPAAAPATAPAGGSHAVVAGETVYAIAQRHGTTVDAMLAANGLTRQSVIYPGQTLTVPGSTAPAAATPPSAPAAPVTGGQIHTVVSGDTLFGIAQRYSTTTAALLAANGLAADSIIYPGQSITVSPAAAASSSSTSQALATLDAEQSGNAALIISIGRQIGVSDRAIAIGLATAMVESGMRNLDGGDRDSLGLFQQRPSTGWGSPDQIRDAHRSTLVFFGGPGDPNGSATRGLLDIPGWESLSFTQAAQAVQISAYPERYGAWETQAYQWLAQYG